MFGYERFDMVTGTVSAVTRKGVIVEADGFPENSVCFCPVGLTVGDTAFFTIRGIIHTDGIFRVLLSFDSIIEFAAIAG